ncbi:2-oxo-4-hydroxy-4-carboxy-5-ureidoimidazoline decarboxylase [Aquihabitans sp. G128]|uniref:2-oxo-4-hydroxy-4-carboxy-5-ureidoimidazoline decarboxylase n=1 Tax=Aquihabitans sp. G128 TaxID=2849779 RepID=UPI001C235C5D|nr:2-oxo-4-hydroxy-4-carboxy-5-ureidoimidazoline decarboxylase [Aquihabitans sp. G128]QXC61061.1 2-oxo-4-hydroxy-4-carboxy-5-ureidoimidazoline decarboxylase [Aquihabitans sp. G128]
MAAAGDGPTVAEVNTLDPAAFVEAFGEVFEATPSLAEAAAAARPFADRAAMVAAFDAAAGALSPTEVHALLLAHPVLGTRKPMAAASQDEQAGAGLRDLDGELRAEIAAGNEAYLERFGFPFIIAVRGLGPAEIAGSLAERLGHDAEVERATAFEQVRRIAALRIEAAVRP